MSTAKWDSAASALFSMISGHSHAEVEDYGNFFSDLSNSSVLLKMRELCEHFDIDSTKLEQFAIATRKCDYCGLQNAPNADENGEHICKECLGRF